ncbi:MAG: nucleotidyltransferase family protein [Pseudomonadota bacterium]
MVDPITHAMVLAAGLGTRMRPITNTIPKPLVKVGGRAILDRNIDHLHAHGVRDVVVNGHHLMPKMQAHLQAHNDPQLVFSPEPELLDQGGGIRAALPHLGDGDFFILNGDAFWINGESSRALASLEGAWDPARMDFLLLLAAAERATGYDGAGDFLRRGDGQLEFRGDAASAPFVYTGAAIFSRAIMEKQTERVFPLVPLFKQAAACGRLHGVPLAGHWFHIGTPPAIEQAENAMCRLGLAGL